LENVLDGAHLGYAYELIGRLPEVYAPQACRGRVCGGGAALRQAQGHEQRRMALPGRGGLPHVKPAEGMERGQKPLTEPRSGTVDLCDLSAWLLRVCPSGGT